SSFGSSCRLAQTRISAASMITRRSTRPSPRATRLPCRCCSTVARIQSCARGSTSARHRSKWRRQPDWTVIAEILARRGQPLRQRLRSGLVLLLDIPGAGEPVRRHHRYGIRLRLWLNRGEAVRWQTAWGPVGAARLEDNGATLITEVRIDRRSLV